MACSAGAVLTSFAGVFVPSMLSVQRPVPPAPNRRRAFPTNPSCSRFHLQPWMQPGFRLLHSSATPTFSIRYRDSVWGCSKRGVLVVPGLPVSCSIRLGFHRGSARGLIPSSCASPSHGPTACLHLSFPFPELALLRHGTISSVVEEHAGKRRTDAGIGCQSSIVFACPSLSSSSLRCAPVLHKSGDKEGLVGKSLLDPVRTRAATRFDLTVSSFVIMIRSCRWITSMTG